MSGPPPANPDLRRRRLRIFSGSSTRLIVAATLLAYLAIFVCICVPGMPSPEYVKRPTRYYVQFDNGWPWTFFQRLEPADTWEQAIWTGDSNWSQRDADDWLFYDGDDTSSRRPPWLTPLAWRLDETGEWRPWAAIANVAVAILGAMCILLAFEYRLHRRGSLLRYTLFDLGVATIVIAAVGAWWANGKVQARREFAILKETLSSKNGDATRAYTGPIWLARIAGRRTLPFWNTTELRDIDYPLANEKCTFSAFPCLQTAIIYVETQEIEALLDELGKMRQLKRLELHFMKETLWSVDSLARLESAPLESLSFGGTVKESCQIESLGRIASLRELHVTVEPELARQLVETTARLPRLEQLHVKLPWGAPSDLVESIGLSSARRPAPDLSPLRNAAHLKRMTLINMKIDRTCIEQLVELMQLNHVVFDGCTVMDSSVEALSSTRPDVKVETR